MTIMIEQQDAVADPQPSLATIARLVEQCIAGEQDTRARLDDQIAITTLKFDGFQQQIEGAENLRRAEFLTLSGGLAEVRRHVGTVEDHVGLLTAKSAEHDQRFDRVDARFDAIDERFDQMDARFEQVDARFAQMETRFEHVDARFEQVDERFAGIDTRLDGIDARLDGIDARLDSLTALTVQIRDAVVPPENQQDTPL